MTDKNKTEKPKKEKSKKNTMDITLINSEGVTITATGPCTDTEIKAICKACGHSKDQCFEIN